MMTALKVWMTFRVMVAQNRAQVLSRHSGLDVLASVNSIPVGSYRNGRKVS